MVTAVSTKSVASYCDDDVHAGKHIPLSRLLHSFSWLDLSRPCRYLYTSMSFLSVSSNPKRSALLTEDELDISAVVER